MKKFLMMGFLINLSSQAMQVGGGTILHVSVACNDSKSVLSHLKYVSLELLNAQTQSGSTALHMAVGSVSSLNSREIENKKIIIQALLDKGINTKLKDKMGMTAYDKLHSSNHFVGKNDLLALFEHKN